MIPASPRLCNSFLASALTIANVVFFCSTITVAEEKTRSVQYIETSASTSRGPDYVAQVFILDGNLKRMSVKRRPKDGFQAEPIAAPDLNDPFEVHDAKNGRRVFVYTDKRQFVRVKNIRHCYGPGKYRDVEVKPDPDVNFDAFLRQPIPTANAKELPERIVDGRPAIGFLVEDRREQATWTETYWVDPQTKLPIRIERRYQPSDPKEDGSELVRRSIIFDAPLDRSLFNTDPPAGYSVLPDAEY
jgi:hypothetical protein